MKRRNVSVLLYIMCGDMCVITYLHKAVHVDNKDRRRRNHAVSKTSMLWILLCIIMG